MMDTAFRTAALAALALGAAFAAAPASAQEVFAAPAGARVDYAQPAIEDEMAAVPPNAIRHYTCAYNELHTRLERKNCGGNHYRYGY